MTCLRERLRRLASEPYRVDRDHRVAVPIEDIERRIRETDICFAEISEDNPNVWYELGFAVASGKPVVLACSERRTTGFPFDVQHRHIIKYKSESPSDFTKLKKAIAERLKGLHEKRERIAAVSDLSPVVPTEGLSEHEIVALVTLAQTQDSPDNSIAAYLIREGMSRAGFTDIAVTLALRGLTGKALIKYTSDIDINGNEFVLYQATEEGMKWLEANIERLMLKRREKPPTTTTINFDNDDDLPF